MSEGGEFEGEKHAGIEAVVGVIEGAEQEL